MDKPPMPSDEIQALLMQSRLDLIREEEFLNSVLSTLDAELENMCEECRERVLDGSEDAGNCKCTCHVGG